MREQDIVIKTIKDILTVNFNFSRNILEDSLKFPLTSSYFNMDAVQLYQLLMCIEETFHIYFEPADMVKNKFLTLSDIKMAIETKLQEGKNI